MRLCFPNRTLLLGLVALVLTLPAGCTRRFFRNRADKEVEAVLKQKDKYPDWKIDQYHVYPDPRARFADWTNPDRPPMPPDDPAARDLAPNPQKPRLAGVKYIEGTNYLDLMTQWNAENRERKERERAGQPQPDLVEDRKLEGEDITLEQMNREIDAKIEAELAARLGPNQEPGPKPQPFLLNLEQTVQLGFFNSREFQTVREGLYLNALPVTLERFAFIAQPFVAGQAIRESAGRQNVDRGFRGWVANTSAGISKVFPTGALLLFNFANQTVYNLGSSAAGTTSVSTVSFDVVQPLLAGAGWAVALEPLTQAERNLLYAIRDFMRFRQEYFVFFAAGQPTFIPGVQPGVPAITSGTVSSPAPFVPPATPLPAVANNPTPVQVAPTTAGLAGPVFPGFFLPTPQGFLSTIGERANLVNTYKNIYNLERFLRLFRVWEEGGIVNRVQVNAVEQQLLASIEGVLSNQVTYRVSLDQLKQQLGLPMNVVIDLDDSALRPMIDQTQRFEEITRDFEATTAVAIDYARQVEPAMLRERLRQLFRTTPVIRNTRFEAQFPRRWAVWEGLGQEALEKKLASLRADLKKFREKLATIKGKTLPPDEQARFDEVLFEYSLGLFELNLRAYEKEPWKAAKTKVEQIAMRNDAFRRVQRGFYNLLEEPFAERLEIIRRSWPELPPVCVEGVDLMRAPEGEAIEAAQRAALANRLDLMNTRGQLVDAWRKVRVAANALMGVVNVDYHFDASSPEGHGQPFNIGGSTTRHQLIFNWQLPLVRVLQRNEYRSTLINYQQMRRTLMLVEDNIVFDVRLDLRNLRQVANNYEIVQKRQIELAYIQVDQALQAFSQPQAPQGPGEMPGLVGPTAPRPSLGDPAALTTQLLSAQSSLLRAQSDLYNQWIAFLTGRMNLYRDLGLMPLDNRGVWLDDVANCTCTHPERPAAGPDAGSRPAQGELPPPRALPPTQAAPLEPKR